MKTPSRDAIARTVSTSREQSGRMKCLTRIAAGQRIPIQHTTRRILLSLQIHAATCLAWRYRAGVSDEQINTDIKRYSGSLRARLLEVYVVLHSRRNIPRPPPRPSHSPAYISEVKIRDIEKYLALCTCATNLEIRAVGTYTSRAASACTRICIKVQRILHPLAKRGATNSFAAVLARGMRRRRLVLTSVFP